MHQTLIYQALHSFIQKYFCNLQRHPSILFIHISTLSIYNVKEHGMVFEKMVATKRMSYEST